MATSERGKWANEVCKIPSSRWRRAVSLSRFWNNAQTWLRTTHAALIYLIIVLSIGMSSHPEGADHWGGRIASRIIQIGVFGCDPSSGGISETIRWKSN